MQVIVIRQGSKARVDEYPESYSDAFRKYYEWINFYSKQEGITLITLKLPMSIRSTRIINGIVSSIKGGEFYANPSSYKKW